MNIDFAADLLPILILGLAAFLVGLGKGGLGGSIGALVTILMAQVVPIEEVIGILLPVLILGDTFSMAAHWRKWDRKIALLLLPGAVLGVTVGTYFISSVTSDMLRIGVAIIALVFVAYKFLEDRILMAVEYQPRNWHGWLAGTVSGFTSSLAHAGGPPASIYLLMQDLTPRVFVATSVMFFTILNWIKVPYYAFIGIFNFDFLLRVIWLAPLVPLGVWVGRLFAEKVNKLLFERVILILLLVSAINLLI